MFFTFPTWRCTALKTAARLSRSSAARRAATTITRSWIDPKDSNHIVLGVDQGASVSLDREKPGPPGITRRRRSSTTSPRITSSPTRSTARSRIRAPSRSTAAPITGTSTCATGSCLAAAKAATSPSTLKTRTFSTSRIPMAASAASTTARRSARTSRHGRSVASMRKSTNAATAIPGRRCWSFPRQTRRRSTSARSM